MGTLKNGSIFHSPRIFPMRTFLILLASLSGLGLASAQVFADRDTPLLMRQIGLAYHNSFDNARKAPANAEDLKKYLEGGKAYDLLKSGKVVFIYNVSPLDMVDGTTNTVLAYEKDAATMGGYCLFGDGVVKKLSAEEFASAKKAKPRKR